MGYTVYNRSLYRNGFRPYGSTNTSAAASGMGGTPFDPEFLHGTHHQRGYPFSERGGWRLGGQPMPMALANPTPSTPSQIMAAVPPGTPPPSVSDVCSEWDFFFDPTGWQSCADTVNRAQIQSVADNAAFYYGPGSAAAQAATAAAAEQIAQVPSDSADVAQVYGAGSLIATPHPGGATIPTWALAALLVGGAMLLKNA
jgi:hypothetical protein